MDATEGLWQGLLPRCPEGSTICCATVAVAQVSEGSLSLTSFVPRIRSMKTVGTGQAFSSFSRKLWKGFLNSFPHCFFLPSFSSPLDLCHCLQSIGQVIIFHFWKLCLKLFTYDWDSNPCGRNSVLCLVTVMSYQDLSLAKTHGAQFQDLVKLRFFMSHCKKFSERHSNR